MPLHWRYAPQTSHRDLRLDFLRGYFVVVMSIDHLRMFPAWTLPFTGGGRLWVTAAEGFILVSGIVFGNLYRSRAKELGWHKVIAIVAKRALKLYLLAVVGQFLLATGDFILREWRGRPTHVPEAFQDLLKGSFLQIHFSYPYLDILVLYALLLLWGVLAVYLLEQKRWKLVLFGSFILWYAWQQEPASFAIFYAYFKFAIWQFLFILGVVGGYYREELYQWWRRLPLPTWLITLILAIPALLFLFLSYQVVYHDWPMPDYLHIFTDGIGNRQVLSLNRIIFALWLFVALYGLVSWLWRPLNQLLGWLFLLLGQNALLAYLWQAVLTYMIHRLPGYPFEAVGPMLMGFVHVGFILVLWFLVQQLHEPFQAWLQR
ncbi:MAG: OpgC domain-containing protein [Anaerolineae bacterium]|nr:OpgC domain-containing protein [Anaerolineae bacterium]